MPVTNFKDFFSLPREEEEEKTLEEIKEGIYFRGHNLWLLVLSMAIACIGLNINSPAAVIGAMLISPLMGPIVGIAFGFSIGNRHLLRLGFHNWLVMIAVALASSTLYFLLSPFHEETTQLAGFKNATVFDCFLALFGGFAWFIGIIRKEAIKVIAGVAVSTACIPPLCTAGFGIANGNWEYFWGGFYFYLINCFFIGVGTWILSILLGYQKFYLTSTHNRNTSVLIIIISIILLLPSVLITIKKWDNENLQRRARDYVNEIKEDNPELAIITYEPFQKGDKKFLKITLLNDSTTVNKQKLAQHNTLVKDIELIWQYAPGSAAGSSNSEIKHLQQQITALQNELKTMKATSPAARP